MNSVKKGFSNCFLQRKHLSGDREVYCLSKTLVKLEFISVTNPLSVWFIVGLERESLTRFVDSNYLIDVHNFSFLPS